jgi:hypothetical protein
MKDKLDILSKVSKAEAPPFLYTRITQRIQTLADVPASVKFKFAFAAAAAVILLLNVFVFVKNNQQSVPQNNEPNSAAYSSTINNIYYE